MAGVSVAYRGRCNNECDGKPPDDCCFDDDDCEADYRCVDERCDGDQDAVAGRCKPIKVEDGQCWEHSDCPNGGICANPSICACGVVCLVADSPGNCASVAAE
jgi:hypothetical protein